MAEAGESGVIAGDAAAALAGRSLRIAVIAGEHSGDLLGGRLMRALNSRHAGDITYAGVGGEHMEAEGLRSVFPLSDVAVMGPAAILKRLPVIVQRVYAAVDATLAFDPDIVVIIDSPEFTHPIAKRIRKRRPSIPIVDYVSPSVWAWRPGRARKMRPYVDHVLALLPFEPAAHARLGGPPCTYVGHPMIERYDWIKSRDSTALAARLGLVPGRPVIAVLPGSRPSEVSRLMRPFGKSIGELVAKGVEPEVVVPVVASVRSLIESELAHWPLRPHLVAGDDDKFAAFRLADAALAASGTVTLELALAGTPAIVAYRVDGVARHLRFLVKVPSIVLANLVAGRNIYPEFIQEACNGEELARALAQLLRDGRARQDQIDGLLRIPERMLLDHGTPSERAADVVLAHIPR